MTISEPATLVTDYLLALFTGVLGRRLGSIASAAELLEFIDKARALRWWSVAFMATAVAGAAGGTVHGFQHAMPRTATNLLWLVTLESLVLAAFAVVSAAIVLGGWGWRTRFIATFAAGVAFGSYGLWVIRNPVFLMAILGVRRCVRGARRRSTLHAAARSRRAAAARRRRAVADCRRSSTERRGHSSTLQPQRPVSRRAGCSGVVPVPRCKTGVGRRSSFASNARVRTFERNLG